MTQSRASGRGDHSVRVAMIGAVAGVLAAVIAGVFGLIAGDSDSSPATTSPTTSANPAATSPDGPLVATFASPKDGTLEPNNRFGAKGQITGQDPVTVSRTLWLVIGSQQELYPVQRLPDHRGPWTVPTDTICTSAGLQDLRIYSVPVAVTGFLAAYVAKDPQHLQPLKAEMPKSAELLDDVVVTVAKAPGC